MIKARLEAQGATIEMMKSALRAAICPDTTAIDSTASDATERAHVREHARATSATLSWNPSSSDQLLLAATKDLIERLGDVTSRTIEWTDPLEPAVRHTKGNHSERSNVHSERSTTRSTTRSTARSASGKRHSTIRAVASDRSTYRSVPKAHQHCTNNTSRAWASLRRAHRAVFGWADHLSTADGNVEASSAQEGDQHGDGRGPPRTLAQNDSTHSFALFISYASYWPRPHLTSDPITRMC